MKPVCFPGLALAAVISSRVMAQDCVNLDGLWSVREEMSVTTSILGFSDTTHQTATRTVTVIQDGCSIRFNSSGINPVNGLAVQLPRQGTMSCAEVSATGAAAPAVSGAIYTTNWFNCDGAFKNGQLVFKCVGQAMGIANGFTFTIDISSTNTWRNGPVAPMPEILRAPDDHVVGLGSSATLTVYAAGPCLKFQWRHAGTNLPAATNASFTLREARGVDAGTYSVVVSNFLGSVTSPLALVQVIDLTPPVPAFLAPLPGLRVTTNQIKVTGTATDNVATARVELSVNGGDFVLATGSNRWSGVAALVPGTNLLTVRASDAAGNRSAPVSRTVFYVVPAPLVVITDGSGRIQPNLNGRLLEIGRAYTITAVPSNGWISAGWTGVKTNGATVRFLMASNLSLAAHFVTNPFPPLAGGYRGLFGESPLVRCESSGAIALTLGNAGTFSGALRNAGLTRSFTGRFDATGRARVAVNSSDGNAWVLDFAHALDGSLSGLTGTVSRTGWTAPLLAERTVFNARSNPAPFAPRHTFLVTGLTDPALAGAGDGYGTVTTTRGGSATMAGRLADNAAIASTSPLLRDGWWPLYHPLYAGKGCLLGWMQFRSDTPAGFGGQVNWIRPAISNVKWYRGGFTNISDITGLAYVAPASRADRVLSLEAGQAIFNGGSLSAAFTNLFSLSASGVATNLSTNKMMLTIQPANGIFTGTVKPPGSSSAVSFKGAVLQGFNRGGGILPGTRGSGLVTIEARP